MGIRSVTNAWWANAKGLWDHGLFMHVLRGDLWPIPQFTESLEPPESDGCLAIAVGPMMDKGQSVIDRIRSYKWTLLAHCSDESHGWDSRFLGQEGCKIWMQYATPDKQGDRNILIGWPEDTKRLMPCRKPLSDRKYDLVFSGQVNHKSRHEMIDTIVDMANNNGIRGVLNPSNGFSQGIPREKHLELLTEARLAPCPAGPVHPDSFRLYEALEAGCVPVVEGKWFWNQFNVPFPVVDNWNELPYIVPTQNMANEALAWWIQYKRSFAWNLVDDCSKLSGESMPQEQVTVLISTSPIPSCPKLTHIENAITRVRSYLPKCEIVIMCDGAENNPDYDEYTRRIVEKCNSEWMGIFPIIFSKHVHQAAMTRRALEMVLTKYIMFVEHDTFPAGDIPFDQLFKCLEQPEVNLIRLYPYTDILPGHGYMIGDRVYVNGVPMRKTFQWSQRPHIARKTWYQYLLAKYNGEGFIEELMYPHCTREGWTTWPEWGMWIYSPDDLMHSGHSDGKNN